MTTHRVTLLSTTPVKGLRMQHPEAVELGASGARGDRVFFLLDADGRLTSITRNGPLARFTATWDEQERWLTLTDDAGGAWAADVELGDPVTVDFYGHRQVHGRVVRGPWAEVLGEAAGRPLTLVQADGPGRATDVEPVTLLGEGSLRALERASGLDEVDPRRFRMLIGFSSDEGHLEDTWKGRVVTVGGATLEVGGPVPRCAATTRHPETGRRDAPIVRAIKRYRGRQETGFGPGVPFGVYARVVEGGTVRLGDPLELR
ncbi:MAG TPA: MOSC domain-containing protein [Capillimicrobium sp.]|jgi:uncharacterized protein YcbX